MAERLMVAVRADEVLAEKAAGLLASRIAERGGPEAARVAGEADVILDIRPEVGAEGFCIAGGPGEMVTISGGDGCGLLYGVGKFLRTCRYAGGFAPSAWRGTSVPAKPVRGMYFATHFHNFYHDAPLQDVARYVEDLALWGYNYLAVWFDMHHYTGIDDPEARAMLERLRAILRAAQGVGMRLALTTLTNEGYSTTPEALRATDPKLGFYGVEVCPSTTEGEALILKNHRERLEAFADMGIDAVWLWPYDQGGCACAQCRPWGANGMVRLGEQVARLIRSYFPHAEIIYSTWLFDYHGDQGEWRGLAEAFSPRPDWVDYLMADSHTTFPEFPLREGVPGGLPMLNFPEISMWGMYPWGGFGANPLVGRFRDIWASMQDRSAGGFPYSEGIFEDLNKALYAGFYWTGTAEVEETIREYAGYELGGADSETVARVLELLEANHAPVFALGFRPDGWFEGEVAPLAGYENAWQVKQAHRDAERAADVLALCRQIDLALPGWARTGWRWRLVYLRALLDAELLAHGDPTPACEEALQEITQIYHAQHGDVHVRPAVREAVEA
ncbi:MAG: beta-N-acetylhexosaminidase family protein [Armatimonadota bacterium]